jgi:UDP-glucose 4-epimerase
VDYYDVNVAGTLSLLKAMEAADCREIIFSSSATVYGEPEYLPTTKRTRSAPKASTARPSIAERVLSDWAAQAGGAPRSSCATSTPWGAHASGRMGEDPQGVPENLMPFLAQVATGRRDALRIWGDDYPTPDGTGIRDYIHVTDLARAHVAALDRFATLEGAEAYNIGTGRGVSVREMLDAFQRVVGRPLPHEVHPRRPGDVAEMRADASKANRELGWQAEVGVDEMVRSLWAWQSANPWGYGEAPGR